MGSLLLSKRAITFSRRNTCKLYLKRNGKLLQQRCVKCTDGGIMDYADPERPDQRRFSASDIQRLINLYQ